MKPQRMCTVCRERREKEELIRVVRFNDEIIIDYDGKAQGRGAYICKSDECINQAQKRRALERAFSGKVDVSVYEKLLKIAEELNEF